MVKIDREGLQGASFGAMDALIMLMGMLIGFGLSYPQKNVVILAIVMTAIADAFANSTAFHVSEETEKFHKRREIWKATIFCFFATIGTFLIPLIPILFLEIKQGIFVSSAIVIVLLLCLGFFVGKFSGRDWKKLSVEYLIMGVIAAVVCYGVGQFLVI